MFNVTKDAKERIGHLLKPEGKKQAGVERAVAGEIVAVAKLKDTEAGGHLSRRESTDPLRRLAGVFTRDFVRARTEIQR